MNDSYISVVIPLYNKEKDIEKAVQSVLSQTHNNFELIIVDDGSTDRSAIIVKNIKDERIKYYYKPNSGVSSARNYGIKKSNYELIAFLDGDDWWATNFLETMYSLQIKFPEAGIYCGQYVQVNKKNELIKLERFPKIDEGYFKLHEYLYAVCSSSVLIRRYVFNECGFFDINLTHGEDTDMWLRIGMKFKICYTSKIISYYNNYSNPLTKSIGILPKFERHLVSKIDIYLQNESRELQQLLINMKINYLEKFYIQYPFDKRIQQLIKSLPGNKILGLNDSILTKNFTVVVIKHFIHRIKLLLIYLRNYSLLLFENIK